MVPHNIRFIQYTPITKTLYISDLLYLLVKIEKMDSFLVYPKYFIEYTKTDEEQYKYIAESDLELQIYNPCDYTYDLKLGYDQKIDMGNYFIENKDKLAIIDHKNVRNTVTDFCIVEETTNVLKTPKSHETMINSTDEIDIQAKKNKTVTKVLLEEVLSNTREAQMVVEKKYERINDIIVKQSDEEKDENYFTLENMLNSLSIYFDKIDPTKVFNVVVFSCLVNEKNNVMTPEKEEHIKTKDKVKKENKSIHKNTLVVLGHDDFYKNLDAENVDEFFVTEDFNELYEKDLKDKIFIQPK